MVPADRAHPLVVPVPVAVTRSATPPVRKICSAWEVAPLARTSTSATRAPLLSEIALGTPVETMDGRGAPACPWIEIAWAAMIAESG